MENVNDPEAMALLPQSRNIRKRSAVVAIDLGSRTTKAVSIQRHGTGFDLLGYTIQDAPVAERNPSPEQLGVHLKGVIDALAPKTRQVALMIGVDVSLLRHAEVPLVPVSELRLLLKFNTKTYLQEELPDHIFDCYIQPPRTGQNLSEPLKGSPKCRVLVGAAKKQLLEQLQVSARNAGLVADQISPGLMALANAFEMAKPEIFAKEAVALVDIGFKASSIIILLNGELILSRVVGIGGDQLTQGLADTLEVSYPEAEKFKVSMPEQIESLMLPLLTPLGRELRASIDFFEHQQDKAVTQVFFSGGSARSTFILQALQSELMLPCQLWSPIGFLNLALPPQQLGELEQIAPHLAVATGGALAAF